jgi:hypothetical protein
VLPPERRAGLYRNGAQAGCAHVCLRVRPDCRTTHRQSFQRSDDYESPSYRALPFALVDRADQEIAFRFGRSGFTAIMFPLPPDMANSPNMP